MLLGVRSIFYGWWIIGVVLVSTCPPAETFVVIERAGAGVKVMSIEYPWSAWRSQRKASVFGAHIASMCQIYDFIGLLFRSVYKSLNACLRVFLEWRLTGAYAGICGFTKKYLSAKTNAEKKICLPNILKCPQLRIGNVVCRCFFFLFGYSPNTQVVAQRS